MGNQWCFHIEELNLNNELMGLHNPAAKEPPGSPGKSCTDYPDKSLASLGQAGGDKEERVAKTIQVQAANMAKLKEIPPSVRKQCLPHHISPACFLRAT